MNNPKRAPEAKPVSTVAVFAFAFVLGGIIALSAVTLYRLEGEESRFSSMDLPLPATLLAELGSQDTGVSVRDAFAGPGLVNFWATWCRPCEKEHPVLMDIAASGVPVYGILYHDDAAPAEQFLKSKGSPFTRVLVDDNGSTGVAVGLTGVPETLLIDSEGRIKARWVGLITESVWAEQMRPVYLSLTEEE